MNRRNHKVGLSLLGALALWLTPVSAQIKMSSRELPPLPDKLGVAGAFAGVSGDALIVAGGANFPDKPPWEGGTKKWHDEIYVLSYGTTNWLTGFKLPRPLAYGLSVPFDGGVLCIGGSDNLRHHAEVFLLRWRDGRVLVETNFPPLPQPLANACGIFCKGCVCVIGGETTPGATTAQASAWRLKLSAAQPAWERLPDLPGPGRSLAMAATTGNSVYVLGGVALSAGPDGKPMRRYLSDVYALPSSASAWERKKDLPVPLAAAPSPTPLVGSGWIALLGGDDGSRYGFQPPAEHPGFSSNILLWHPSRMYNRLAGVLTVSRVTTPTVVWRDEFIVPSGEVRPGVRSPAVRAYRIEAP
jgi:N-acetylneuraminic acid mutarotase